MRLGAAITATALLIPGCRKDEKTDLTVTEILIVEPASGYLELLQGDSAISCMTSYLQKQSTRP